MITENFHLIIKPLEPIKIMINRFALFVCAHKYYFTKHFRTSFGGDLNHLKKGLLLSLCLGLLTLSGCNDRVKLATDAMSKIRNSKSEPVEPVPKPTLVDDYVYDASELRSPFMPPSLLSKQQFIDSNSGITPDNTREKEALEAFELVQLVYRGRVVSPEGIEFGLVQRPDGVVDSVKVGDYMGMNHGRIIEITATQINLIEIVPDNRAGYIEKPASVVSPI